MARHRADWWAERLEELEQSGDAKSIARRHGIREKTLLWWRTELRRRACDRHGDLPGPRLLPVVVGPATVAAASSPQVEVLVESGAARMTVRGAVSPEHLAALMTAASRRC
jgi:transposase-like protein